MTFASLIAVSLMLLTAPVSRGEEVPFRSSDINEKISIEHAWKRFIKVCGLAISDPSGYFATLPETGLLGERVRAESGDGNLLTADLMNGRIVESVVIARIGSSEDIDCHFVFDVSKETSAEEMAQQFLQFIKSKLDWEYAGGYAERELPSLAVAQSVHKVGNYQYSILNVWGRRDVSVEVTIGKYHVYLGVSAINRD